MAYESPSFYGSFPASTGLKQYTFVTLSTNGLLRTPTTLGDAIGVLVSSGTTGSTWGGSTGSGPVQTVQFYGIAKLLSADEAIVPGDRISAVTTGLEIGWAQRGNDDSNLFGLGYAVTEALSTGDESTSAIGIEVISVLLKTIGQGTTAS